MTCKDFSLIYSSLSSELKTITRYIVCSKTSGYIYGLFAYEDSARIFVKEENSVIFNIIDSDTGEVIL